MNEERDGGSVSPSRSAPAAEEIPPPATPAELLAACGYPDRPVPLAYRPGPVWGPPAGRLVERYLYTDGDGEPRFEVLRYATAGDAPEGPGKVFYSRHRGADGQWVWGLSGVGLVLYRLPRVRAAAARGERVFVVEGERDVHALEAAGLTATCNPLGALQWLAGYAEHLRGAHVVVIPDDDLVGRLHGARVAASLLGVAAPVRFVRLTGLREREDVSDWFQAGHGRDELLALAANAPADPSPDALAALLGLPPGLDLRTLSAGVLREQIRAMHAAGTPAEPVPSRPPPPPSPADVASSPFALTEAVFQRLNVALPAAGGPDAAYGAIRAALRAAPAGERDRLDDAFRLERDCHEAALFASLSAASRLPRRQLPPADHGAVLALAPAVRLTPVRHDWEGWLARGEGAPPEAPAEFVVSAADGNVTASRLNPLAAAVLKLCAERQPLAEIVAAIAASLSEPAPESLVRPLVERQLAEFMAAGIVVSVDGDDLRALDDAIGATVSQPPPEASAWGTRVGILSRVVLSLSEAVDGCRAPAPGADGAFAAWHDLDGAFAATHDLLGGTPLARVFATEFGEYWTAGRSARVTLAADVHGALWRALEQRAGWIAGAVFA